MRLCALRTPQVCRRRNAFRFGAAGNYNLDSFDLEERGPEGSSVQLAPTPRSTFCGKWQGKPEAERREPPGIAY